MPSQTLPLPSSSLGEKSSFLLILAIILPRPRRGATVSSLPPVTQVSRNKSGHHRMQGHKVTGHTRLLCAQPSSKLFISSILLPQLTRHYVFMDKFFPQSRSNPWENHLASNKTRFLKQDQTPPEQKHWVRTVSPSTVPCTSPQDTSPSTRAQLLATLLSLLPMDSSTVTLATAELLGSQAVCPKQMPTCHYLQTPESLSISSQVPPPSKF